MNEREWSKFFELMKQITDLPMAVDEKARMVAQEAKDRGEEETMTLEEFTSWDFEPEDE